MSILLLNGFCLHSYFIYDLLPDKMVSAVSRDREAEETYLVDNKRSLCWA